MMSLWKKIMNFLGDNKTFQGRFGLEQKAPANRHAVSSKWRYYETN
jgi:hypothetical protein